MKRLPMISELRRAAGNDKQRLCVVLHFRVAAQYFEIFTTSVLLFLYFFAPPKAWRYYIRDSPDANQCFALARN